MDRRASLDRSGAVRPRGLLVLVGIVVLGLLTGVGFYRLLRGRSAARLAAQLAVAPKTPAERAALWLQLSGPQIHHRLAVVGRFDPRMPWLVTHALAHADGGPPELFGIDCADLPRDLARLEGLKVIVELPPPRVLGRATLDGPRAERVPLYSSAAELDPGRRLSELALYLLQGVPKALARDVPGAELEIRVRAEPTD